MIQKKIRIFTISLGRGHNTAAQGLYDKFFKKGCDVEIINLSNINIYSRLLIKIFNIATSSSLIWKYIFTHSNKSSRSFLSRLFTRIIFSKPLQYFFSENKNIDEVWITNPIFSEEIDTYFFGKKYIQVTDYGEPHSFWSWGKSHTIFTLDTEGAKKFLKKHPEKNLITREFPLPQKTQDIKSYSLEKKNYIKKKLKISENTKVFLFFYHNFLFGNEISILERYIQEENSKNAVFIILAGKNKPLFSKYSKFSHYPNIKIFSWRDDISDLYAISDFIIGKAGGAFIAEIIFLQKDFFIYNALPGQEENNQKFLENIEQM